VTAALHRVGDFIIEREGYGKETKWSILKPECIITLPVNYGVAVIIAESMTEVANDTKPKVKKAPGYPEHWNGSRKSKVRAEFDANGMAAARKLAKELGLKSNTINSWMSQFRVAKKKRAHAFGQPRPTNPRPTTQPRKKAKAA
jgi:hypothetical protein